MMSRTMTSVGVATVAVLLAVAGQAELATAAVPKSLTWRIAKIYSVASGVSSVDSVDAVTARQAWLAAETFPAAPGQAPVLVQHWSRGTWQSVPVPASVDPGNLTLAGDVIAATSPTNAWLFTGYQGSAGPFAVALRWNGHKWRKHVFPLFTAVRAAAVFGPADVWAFGDRGGTAPLVARFDGSAWHPVHSPLVPTDASALSPTDIWTVGREVRKRAFGPFAVARWDGHGWRETVFPHLRLPKGSVLASAGILAVSRSSVWVDASLAAGMGVAPGYVLLHLTSHGWTRIHVPFPPAVFIAMTRDGRGGLVFAEGATTVREYLLHYFRGHWTRQLAPSPAGYLTQISGLSWAPGARFGWAASEVLKNGASQGALLRS